MIIVTCPHCECQVEILEVNCRIFRHGVFKQTGAQVPPHSSKENCDMWFVERQVYGCTKPFKLVQETNGDWIAQVCDYI